jgi:2-oxoisovalerate dehydrogenase E1 component
VLESELSSPADASAIPPAAIGNQLPRLADYETAFLIREVETRLLTLFSEGKLNGTVHTCIGQEWTGVAIARHLVPGDEICSNHRGHGHFLAQTGDVTGLIAEVMGRQSGVVSGRGGSQHLQADGFFSNGIQGGMIPVAAGLAWAKKMAGSGNIVVVFIGDGTLGEGTLYETLNIASRHDLPLLVELENNLYAQSTSQRQTLAGDILSRAESFGIANGHADTWELEALFDAARRAVDYVRDNIRPFFLRIDTYRLMAHSKGDDDRDEAEVADYRAKDALHRFTAASPGIAEPMVAKACAAVDAAVTRAEASPESSLAVVSPAVTVSEAARWSAVGICPRVRFAERLYQGLGAAMERDERVVIFGEDIEAPYGGAFKVTRDLSARFPHRVTNMPIGEASIIGIGNGLALGGLRPVCEIMFGDFLTLAADQLINHAAKFSDMYGDRVSVPLLVRVPMGGRRGYGPTHSQSLEKHFLGVPHLTVLAVNHRYDPAALLDRIFTHIAGPILLIENKVQYTVMLGGAVPAGFVYEQTDAVYPTLRLRPGDRPEVTIVCYGGMLSEVETAALALFDEHDIVAEIIGPTQLYPLDLTPILGSVSQTRRLVIAEEGQGFAAFGAEVVASLVEAMPMAPFAVARVNLAPRSIPSSGPAEKAHLPSSTDITGAALDLFGDG